MLHIQLICDYITLRRLSSEIDSYVRNSQGNTLIIAIKYSIRMT